MKNQKISKSLKLFHKKKKINHKLKLITVSILITAGILTASYQAIMRIKFNIMFANISSASSLTEQQVKEIYGDMYGYSDDSDMEATAPVPASTAGGAVVSVPEPVVSVKEQIRQIAEKANFKYTDYLVRLAFCENRICNKMDDE